MQMTMKDIIDGLTFTKEMFLFDPSTGETKTKEQLNDMDRTTVDACEGAIELLNQYPQWVPCSERLPKYEMDVLLQFNSNMCVGYYHPSESWIIWSGGTWCTGVLEGDEEPIAWMPLPEPYSDKEQGE